MNFAEAVKRQSNKERYLGRNTKWRYYSLQDGYKVNEDGEVILIETNEPCIHTMK